MRSRHWLTVLCLVIVAGCSEKPAEPLVNPGKPATPANPVGTLKELKKQDLKVGSGDPARVGDTVAVIYSGKLENGTEFDSNTAAGSNPFSFIIGRGSVIKGWDEGLVGMKVGGKRRLSIPSAMGYRSEGSLPRIPPNADLMFEIELLDVIKKEDAQIYDKRVIKAGTGPRAKKGDEVTIHYLGTLVNGVKFDSSRDRGQPFTFTLGMAKVLAGLDAGLIGMKAGGVCELKLPPELAYGHNGRPPVPADAKLIFKVELLKIKRGK